MHERYVDDTFAIFKTESDSKMFYNKLNSLHPSLKFTMEKETDGILPYLDVKIEKDTNKFLLLFTRNLLLLGSTHAGTRLDLLNAKPTSLARYLISQSPKKSAPKTNHSRSLITSDL